MLSRSIDSLTKASRCQKNICLHPKPDAELNLVSDTSESERKHKLLEEGSKVRPKYKNGKVR